MALEQALTLLEAKGLAIAEVIHDDNTQTGSKLQLVQRVSVHLKLSEAGANMEIQSQRPLKYPELAAHDFAYKLESWIYTCAKMQQSVRTVFRSFPLGDCVCGETHKAVVDFLKKYITENKMKCYVRAKENFISETFHSVINKFATKRMHFDASHTARLACAAMDWNENIQREVWAVYHRALNDTAVRRRAKTNKALVDRTSIWKNALANRVFI
ncbi:hypothetical protein R1flu_017993 [Riccia fluitans]|uniref:Transposase n=1 Tax=Riccia fluitans TaxID=41844 RepID=A0ABD1ZFV4_9MARC